MGIRLDIRPPDMGGGHAPLTIEPSLSSHFSMEVRRRLDITPPETDTRRWPAEAAYCKFMTASKRRVLASVLLDPRASA